jgi:hypothetical protein
VHPALGEGTYTDAKPSLKGSATWSQNTSGAAPVPPFAAVDGDEVRRAAGGSRSARASSCQKSISPTADLMPTGRPVASARRSMKSSIVSTS